MNATLHSYTSMFMTITCLTLIYNRKDQMPYDVTWKKFIVQCVHMGIYQIIKSRHNEYRDYKVLFFIFKMWVLELVFQRYMRKVHSVEVNFVSNLNNFYRMNGPQMFWLLFSWQYAGIVSLLLCESRGSNSGLQFGRQEPLLAELPWFLVSETIFDFCLNIAFWNTVCIRVLPIFSLDTVFPM